MPPFATARNSWARQAREAIARHQARHPVFEQTLSTVIEGDRRVFAVTDFAGSERLGRHRRPT